MVYSDFVVAFGSAGTDGTAIEVSSPAGEARGIFRSLPQLLETPHLLPGLWRDLNFHSSLPDPQSLRKVGLELFSGIFSGTILTLFETSVAGIDPKRGGLRIMLKFGLHPQADLLHALPWEFLYWPQRDAYLALSHFTPIIRYVELPQRRTAAPISKLRVMLVAPEPWGSPKLEIKEECESIRTALGTLANLEVVLLAKPTIEALRHALLDAQVNVIHFAGTASYNHQTGEAGLLFEGSEGGSASLRGDQLAVLLGAAPGMRLVFLNSCDTARTMGAADSNPFRNVALALVACGLPAVIGMQFPISDRAARHFGEVFYQRLAAGDTIDVALTEGRRSVHARDPESVEWGTPVLLSSAPDGALFAVEGQSTGDRRRLAVFLCHAAEDKEFVRGLYRRLTLAGYDVWLDEEKILPGQAWEPEITRAMRNSDAVVVCLSKKAVTKAGFVQKEIAIALNVLQQQPEGAIYLVPVKIEDCPTPGQLQHLQFVHIDNERGFNRLLASLAHRREELNI